MTMNTKWIETPYLQFKEHTESVWWIEEIIFADGGVIGRNPSSIGGTYAWTKVLNHQHTKNSYGVATASYIQKDAVSNNHTEMLAILNALKSLEDNWHGHLCSDSQITLGRLWLSWKWNNIPQWMHATFQEQRHRLVNWESITPVLLSGHPTRKQLEIGIGSRGYPVSPFNKWCDDKCQEAAMNYAMNNVTSTIQNKGG